MTPRISKAVDPIFLEVVELLSRIQKQEISDAAREKQRIRNRIDLAEDMLGPREEEWMLAKYALVAWIDDVLYQAAWPGRDWWENNPLEIDYFQSREAATEFFEKSKQAGSLRSRDALEVYYLCVMLGFRGIYRKPEEVAAAQTYGHDLPPDLGKWARNVARGIQTGIGRPPISENPKEGEGAPPLKGKFNLVGALFCTITMIVIFIFTFNANKERIEDFITSARRETR